ncbi:MAG TPA: hypothetical protein VIS48_12175 [Candidatus Kryptonia bacterium]
MHRTNIRPNKGENLSASILLTPSLAAQFTMQLTCSGTEIDIYAQRFDQVGYLYVPLPSITLAGDVANDQGADEDSLGRVGIRHVAEHHRSILYRLDGSQINRSFGQNVFCRETVASGSTLTYLPPLKALSLTLAGLSLSCG